MSNLINRKYNFSTIYMNIDDKREKFYDLREIGIKFNLKYDFIQLKLMSLYYKMKEKLSKYLKHFIISYNDNRPGIILISYTILKKLIKRIYGSQASKLVLKLFNQYDTILSYEFFIKEDTPVELTEVSYNNTKFNINNTTNDIIIRSTELSNQMGIEHYYLMCFIENIIKNTEPFSIESSNYTNINGMKYKVYFINYGITNFLLNNIKINGQKYQSPQKEKIIKLFHTITDALYHIYK